MILCYGVNCSALVGVCRACELNGRLLGLRCVLVCEDESYLGVVLAVDSSVSAGLGNVLCRSFNEGVAESCALAVVVGVEVDSGRYERTLGDSAPVCCEVNTVVSERAEHLSLCDTCSDVIARLLSLEMLPRLYSETAIFVPG